MDEKDSTADLCDKLQNLYLAEKLSYKLHLKWKLYKLKMEGGTLMDHMHASNGLCGQLQKACLKIERDFFFIPTVAIL